eukprot:2154235-Rhodomonas_salina.1
MSSRACWPLLLSLHIPASHITCSPYPSSAPHMACPRPTSPARVSSERERARPDASQICDKRAREEEERGEGEGEESMDGEGGR